MARGHMPRRAEAFTSQAQWHLFFASPKLRRYAKKKADAAKTPFKALPPRKGARKR